MHSRSLKIVDPRISTISGWSTPGFHRPGRYRVRTEHTKRGGGVSVSRAKGGLHPTKNHLRGGRTPAPCVYFRGYQLAASDLFICFSVWPLGRSSGGRGACCEAWLRRVMIGQPFTRSHTDEYPSSEAMLMGMAMESYTHGIR